MSLTKERLTLLEARLGTILNIAEGGLTDKVLPEIARLAREALRAPAEPSGCPEHGMEHFFEGMCIKCGVVPAVKSSVAWKCDWPGCTLRGWHGHAGLPPDYK